MFKNFSFTLLRTPLQSLSKAYNFSDTYSCLFEEGLFLSSSEFWKELLKKDNLDKKEKDKLELSFAKFWIRSSMRSTPYGTFAGSAILEIASENTNLIIDTEDKHCRKIRLDMNYISELTQKISNSPIAIHQIKFFPNNTIYELLNSFRYVEYRIENNIRKYVLSSFEKTDEIRLVLEKSKNGARIKDLIKMLLTNENEREEINDYILSLISSQILLSELEPCITGEEPMDRLLRQLKDMKGLDSNLLNSLQNIHYRIKHPIGGIEQYQTIEKELKDTNMIDDFKKETLQLDLFLALKENKINKDIITKITSEVEELAVLSLPNNNKDLTDFKERFYSRFEEREIPLSIALDSDLGIGYAEFNDVNTVGEKLVGTLFAMQNDLSNLKESNFIQDFALRKYIEFIKKGNENIEITSEDLKDFKSDKIRLPNSMYIMGSLIKKDSHFENDFIFDLSVFNGPSAGNLLGRFAHGDAELLKLTKEIVEKEEKEFPDAIYAEIVHLPQARIGNVILRPLLRKYEIPYVGNSGSAIENQITISDLVVCIRNGEIVLKSKKYNKRIIPRLTNAHNFSYNNLPIYKFLCDLQFYKIYRPILWDWGKLSSLNYLPRVMYKDIVIKKAMWKFKEDDIVDLDKNNLVKYFQSFRQKWSLPNRLLYIEGDHKLLIDLENEVGAKLLLHYLNKYKFVLLEEFLFDEKNCIVKDSSGKPYTNELIIPIYQDDIKHNLPSDTFLNEVFSAKRKYSPFSEWLYFKIYCGTKIAEKILREKILKFAEGGIENKLFEKFFFVRYKDNDSHIRIRFFNQDMNKQKELYSCFISYLQPLLDKESIDRISLDTYSREIERYGNETIQEVESLFYNDSITVLKFINLLENESDEDYRLIFAMRGIDFFLNDFNFSLSEKRELLAKIQTNFFEEFGGTLSLQRQLNEKYRVYQKIIFSHMSPENDSINEIEDGINLFIERSKMNQPIIEVFLTKISSLEIDIKGKLFFLISSFIHMYMNRLFISNQRKYELVVYHFLLKYYNSQKAILNNFNK